MNKNLTIKMGNCNHRRYIPKLIDLVRTGVIDPTQILTQAEPLSSAIERMLLHVHRQASLPDLRRQRFGHRP